MKAVLDTNVWLDWLVFDDPSTRTLLRARESGSLVLLASIETRAEWLDVIARPVFGLDDAARRTVIERYERHCVLAREPGAGNEDGHDQQRYGGLRPADIRARPSCTPLLCRDADDQKFLELAVASAADFLVTRDRALLDLAVRARRHHRLQIVRPDAPCWQESLATCLKPGGAAAHL